MIGWSAREGAGDVLSRFPSNRTRTQAVEQCPPRSAARVRVALYQRVGFLPTLGPADEGEVRMEVALSGVWVPPQVPVVTLLDDHHDPSGESWVRRRPSGSPCLYEPKHRPLNR